MTRILTSYPVSATVTTDPLRIPRSGVGGIWSWRFTQSGAGSNQMLITAQRAANWEVGDSALQLFDMSSEAAYDGPYLVTDEQITNATDSELLLTYWNPGVFEYLVLTFTLSGGGSRTFSVDLWA